ncbi:27546_t:CDS:2 [Racocetra persica]|uniref:27546_t:CDS:1 n=1 Tax=Racocetra persica TaxID=160502 RepID=A0ACA9KS97_9GLOM|nr:27546_t:CDS:2 [Racocetra persica]
MASQNLSSVTLMTSYDSSLMASPPDPVWKHFVATPLKSPGHFSAQCKYCATQFNRRCLNELVVHLTKECEDESLDNETRSKYLEIAIQRQLSKEQASSKNQSKKQKISINDYWENEN